MLPEQKRCPGLKKVVTAGTRGRLTKSLLCCQPQLVALGSLRARLLRRLELRFHTLRACIQPGASEHPVYIMYSILILPEEIQVGRQSLWNPNP